MKESTFFPLLLFLKGFVIISISFLFSCHSPSYKTGSQAEPQGEVAPVSAEFAIPFPWPPPKASASMVLPRTDLIVPNMSTTFGAIDNRLTKILDNIGYVERSYFSVPDGFALVTRIEQFNRDGTSKEEPYRWLEENALLTKFTLANYIQALFTARVGYYRVITFIISSHPFSQSDKIIGRDEANEWLNKGTNVLPQSLAIKPYTEQHNTTALIYEFEKTENKQPRLRQPSLLTANVHLTKSGFLKVLRQ